MANEEKTKKELDPTTYNDQEVHRGAPNMYFKKVQPYLRDIEKYAQCGVTEKQLAEYYGVSRSQWNVYKKQFTELNDTLLRAKQALKVGLINKAYEVAMGYEYIETQTTTSVDDEGKESTKTVELKKYAKPDAGMLQFLLINRFSDEFARDPQNLELKKKALELAKSGELDIKNMGGV